MSRKLTLLSLLLLPVPAWASDGSGGAIVGAASLVVVVLAALLVSPGTRKAAIAAAALFGIVVAGYLAVQHTSTEASVCNISGTFNCDVVNKSEYSELGGVPIALLGVAYYVAMAWLALRHASGGAPKAPALMTALSVLAVGYDVVLFYISAAVLHTYCPLCMVSWALNVLLLVGSAIVWRGSAPAEAGIGDSLKAEAPGVLIVGLVTLLVGHVATKPGATPSLTGAGTGSVEDLASFYEQPAGRIELDGTEPAVGPAGARFTIVEWADYQCPHCALMADELKKVLADNKDVRILYKHYPISNVCNSFVEREGHTDACHAAKAAECARLQGKFWELNAQMFKNQEFLGKEDVKFMAGQLQLDMAAFETCLADPSSDEAVKQDIAAGGVAGIDGTPSVFVKGVLGDQWVRVNGGREQINALLQAARDGKQLPPARPHPDHGH